MILTSSWPLACVGVGSEVTRFTSLAVAPAATGGANPLSVGPIYRSQAFPGPSPKPSRSQSDSGAHLGAALFHLVYLYTTETAVGLTLGENTCFPLHSREHGRPCGSDCRGKYVLFPYTHARVWV